MAVTLTLELRVASPEMEVQELDLEGWQGVSQLKKGAVRGGELASQGTCRGRNSRSQKGREGGPRLEWLAEIRSQGVMTYCQSQG